MVDILLGIQSNLSNLSNPPTMGADFKRHSYGSGWFMELEYRLSVRYCMGPNEEFDIGEG